MNTDLKEEKKRTRQVYQGRVFLAESRNRSAFTVERLLWLEENKHRCEWWELKAKAWNRSISWTVLLITVNSGCPRR